MLSKVRSFLPARLATAEGAEIPASPPRGVAPRRVPDDHRLVARTGYAVIILAFGVMGGWAALSPLGSAVMGPGVLAVDTNKKTVQHLEGGIIREILVHEGDHVEAGQVLFRLDDTQPKANVAIIENQLLTGLARQARLAAELGGRQIEFPAQLRSRSDSPDVARIMDDELKQFRERKGTLDAQIAVLQSRGEQLRKEIDGIDETRNADQQQVNYIKDELKGVQELFDKQLVAKSRYLALERERSRIDGEIGRLTSDRAKAEKGIGESQLQMAQIKQQFAEQASRDLVDAREKIADLQSKLVVAKDVLKRLDIKSPVSGKVQGLKVFTIGAVIRQGEPLLDVVPDHAKLIVQAHISPNDIEGLTAGQTAEVRFPAFHDRTMPMIKGKVTSVSRDRLVDEATKQPYYLALVDVDPEDIPQKYRDKTIPGLAAEVIVPTEERTALNYLVGPLVDQLRTSFREK
jgi:HlyD family type I secretion membrane fusion protein